MMLTAKAIFIWVMAVSAMSAASEDESKEESVSMIHSSQYLV